MIIMTRTARYESSALSDSCSSTGEKKLARVVAQAVELGRSALKIGEYSSEATRLFERFSKEPIHPDSDSELKAYIDKRIMTRPEVVPIHARAPWLED